MTLRLYIWEGNGISDGYHDDGTLVVLAESPEQARAVARVPVHPEPEDYWERGDIWRDGHSDEQTNAAIDREPDRIVELNTAVVVAFNGGGYD